MYIIIIIIIVFNDRITRIVLCALIFKLHCISLRFSAHAWKGVGRAPAPGSWA